jgi:hypothetical protein
MRGWWAASCALALLGFCLSLYCAVAQTSDTVSKTPVAQPKKKAQTPSSRKHTKNVSKPGAGSHSSAGTHAKSSTAVAGHSGKSKYASSRKGGKKVRGQQKIDPERAQEIQEALIREHYLSGEAAGSWNESSEAAMRKYQADHGWQSKTVPDSRALISLGLGPSHDRLLNPESAMTTGPAPTRAATLTPASHSADPGPRLSTDPAASGQAPVTTPAHDAPNPQ